MDTIDTSSNDRWRTSRVNKHVTTACDACRKGRRKVGQVLLPLQVEKYLRHASAMAKRRALNVNAQAGLAITVVPIVDINASPKIPLTIDPTLRARSRL